MPTKKSQNKTLISQRLNDYRYEKLDTFRIISMVPLHPYQEIADIGTGNGLLSLALAKYLFDGRVHVLDTKKVFLRNLESKINQIGVSNVTMHPYSSGGKLPLGTNTLDGVFAACLFNRTRNQSKMMSEIYRAIKPGGWLSVIEWREDSDEGPPNNQRINETEMKQSLQDSNFRFVSKHNLNSCQYLIIVRK